MNRAFLLLIFIHWYPCLLVKSSLSFFSFDKDISQVPYYVNENFSIGGTFNLSSSYKCSYSPCLANLKLTLRNNKKLLMNLWCDSPAVLLTRKYENMDELSCALNGIDATVGSYRLSGIVQVHTAGSFLSIFSAIFPNDSEANQEWSSKKIVVLDSPIDTQQSMKLQTIKRDKRQDMNIDGTNVQSTVIQDDSVNNGNVNPMQTIPDGANAVNQPMQLNTYNGTLNPGHTADLICQGASSCPDYPQTDEQGRAICCFLLPQASDGITALSSVIYQNGTQNLNDFQVNVANGQSFDAANDLSVFLDPVIATSQCNIILPTGTTQSNSAQFRITWTYHSSSADSNSSPPPTATLTDGTLPVNVLRVTSTSAFVQQAAQYNEWFVCPPTQDGQISLLRSIALLAGNNIDYFRCIYVNNQSIPLKDPTNGQLLVFSSSKNDVSDNSTITILPAVHTDCISIQFFPNSGTSIDLESILLSITIAFQTASTTDLSSIVPQVSDLQGTFQIKIDITINISPVDDDNNGQTNEQTLGPSEIDNSENVSSNQCTRYQPDVPMRFDISISTYKGTFDIPSENSQPTIIDSVTVTASSSVENPITMLLVDSQGNTLSPSYDLTSGNTFQDGPNISISKIILQATALQDAAMDSTLHADIVVCSGNTSSSSAPSQTYNPVMNGTGSSSMSGIAPIPHRMAPIQSLPSPSSDSSDAALNCQERTSSTYGTYPPDLSALTIPTKRPPKMPQPQATTKPEMYATPPTPYQNLTVQTLPDHTCFDQISFSNNPFLYDILISTSHYTNSVDCLSPTSGCSINFANVKQPQITLLFSAPACISYLRILSPSNVQQFSYSMYDEDGIQIQLPGATDNQGTLLSSSGANPIVQLSQYSCGYSIILRLLTTSDNGPALRVTIDTGGCFKNLSATTTTTEPVLSPMPPADVPPSWSEQMPSAVPVPSNIQPAVFAPAPVFAPLPIVPLFPSPSPSLLVQPSVPSIQADPSPPFVPLPVLTPSPPPVLQTMLTSPISYPSSPTAPPQLPPSFTMLSSSILQAAPSPSPPNQAMLPSLILSSPPPPFSPAVSFPSPQMPIQSPIMSDQQYSSPVVNPSPTYQAPPIPQPSPQPVPSPIVPGTTTQPLAPLIHANNGQLMQLTFGSQCVSQISTSDSSVVVNENINPGAQGVSFQSNVPITITIHFSCNIQMMHMCIPSSTTNVGLFSYTLKDIYNNPISTGVINLYETDGCIPPPLNIAITITQLIITISQTKDGQSPRNVVLDLQGSHVPTVPTMPTQPTFLAVTTSATPAFSPAPIQPSSQFLAPVAPPIQVQPPVPLQTVPTPVPIQTVPPSQPIPSTSSSQNPVTPVSTTAMDICPEVSLINHPGVELIVFSDGTNTTNDLNSDGDGYNLVSTGTTMTVLLHSGMSATFSSVGVLSSNVNQINVALFDEISNRPLIQSPQGMTQSSITLNPNVQNLPVNPAATLAITFLSTIDGQPPRNVKLLTYACFPTITEILPSPTSTTSSQTQPTPYPSQTSGTNMLNQRPYYPLDPSDQTDLNNQRSYYPLDPSDQADPNNQQYQRPSTGPTNVCIDPNQPAQVTSVGNTPLPAAYYSSTQCVCICQSGIVIPTSSGVIQYYPPLHTINKRTITDKYSEQRRRKRRDILTKSKN